MIRVKGLTLGVTADLPGKPPLLLLHGFLSSRRHWTPNLAALRARYRLILVELPGHGQTPGCTDPDRLHPDALVADLDTARRRLEIPHWHMIGPSLGAGLSLRYALTHPDNVGAQVWTNGNRVLSPPPDTASRAADATRADGIETGGLDALRALPFHPRHGARFDPETRAMLIAEAEATDRATVAALMRHLLPDLPLRDRFAAIQVPTLLINGRQERQFQPTRDLAQTLLPTLEIADLPCGHAVNLEAPEAFNTTVLGFLAAQDHRLSHRMDASL